jgi:hypothetical protein
MKIFFTLIILSFSSSLFSQSRLKQFKQLSRPEKFWVAAHPFVAKKAFRITKQVLSDVDSIKRMGLIGSDLNGGKLDAFKHAYWMASLKLEIGSKKALKLGCAHEKGNKLSFKKHKLEDSILPDSISSEMDFNNNRVGASAVKECEEITRNTLQTRIMALLNEGKLQIIKKDKQGNYLYCDGTFIDTNEWKRKWNVPKCLIPSNLN